MTAIGLDRYARFDRNRQRKNEVTELGDGRRVGKLVFSGHAIQQMFTHGITNQEVRPVVDTGETMASSLKIRRTRVSVYTGCRAAETSTKFSQ